MSIGKKRVRAEGALPTARAIEIVGKFPGKKLLIIGDIMLDRYVFGRVERLNPEAPVPVLHAKSQTCATGGAGNTAKNAVGLGAKATVLGVVGADLAAKELETACRSESAVPILVADPSRPTIEKNRFVVGGQQMLRVDHEETHDISGDVEEQLVEAISREAEEVDAMIVSDYAKGLITERVAAAVMAASSEHGVPVMADVKPSHIERFVGVTYISPNRKEAHEYLGLNQHLQNGCAREALAKQLFDKFKANVFLTLSEDGMFVVTNDTPGAHVPQIHQIEVADTSGCGDTAAVVIMLAKLSGASDVEAALIGNAAGAVIASKIGAVALSQEELLEALMYP